MPNEDTLKDKGNNETQTENQDQAGEEEQFDKDRALATIRKQCESKKP
jgi:hypothetical protein